MMKNARKIRFATPVSLYKCGSNFAIRLKYLKHYFCQKCLQSQNQTVQICFCDDGLHRTVSAVKKFLLVDISVWKMWQN